MKGLWQCSVRRGIFDIYPVYPPSRIFLSLPFEGFNLVSGMVLLITVGIFQAIMLRWRVCDKVLYKAGVIWMNLMTRLSDAIPEPGRSCCHHSVVSLCSLERSKFFPIFSPFSNVALWSFYATASILGITVHTVYPQYRAVTAGVISMFKKTRCSDKGISQWTIVKFYLK